MARPLGLRANVAGARKLAWGCLAIVVSLGLAAVVWLMGHRPDFYRSAMHMAPQERAACCKQFLQRASQLASDVRASPSWQAAFSQNEINAWLSEELPRLQAQFGAGAPLALREPRLALAEGEVLVGGTLGSWPFSRVVWMRIQPWVARPGTLALRLCEVRVGAVPLPTSKVLSLVSPMAQSLDLPMQWKQMDHDLVALVQCGSYSELAAVQHIDVRGGFLYVGTDAPRVAALPDPSIPQESTHR